MMELNKYPLDDQTCTMEIASCKYKIIFISNQLEITLFIWPIQTLRGVSVDIFSTNPIFNIKSNV